MRNIVLVKSLSTSKIGLEFKGDTYCFIWFLLNNCYSQTEQTFICKANKQRNSVIFKDMRRQ